MSEYFPGCRPRYLVAELITCPDGNMDALYEANAAVERRNERLEFEAKCAPHFFNEDEYEREPNTNTGDTRSQDGSIADIIAWFDTDDFSRSHGLR